MPIFKPLMSPQLRSTSRRASAIALVMLLFGALFGASANAVEPTPDLQAQFDEATAAEADLLRELDEAQAASKKAKEDLEDLRLQTEQAKVDLLLAQTSLDQAEALLKVQIQAREEAEAKVKIAKERLRDQIVASYVAGGNEDGILEAVLNAGDNEEVGQALAFGRAVSSSTEDLMKELDKARAVEAKAAKAAREARTKARESRDKIAKTAAFLEAAGVQKTELLAELNWRVLVEAQAVRVAQGRTAIIEGRINALSVASDGVAMYLASIQRNQPDWIPGAVKPISTPVPNVAVGSPYGLRHHPILAIDRLHAGVDLGAPLGTPIHAAADGVVVLAEARGGYGNTVVIDHGNSLATLYGHNSELRVKPGDLVKRGDVIALMGSTGLSTGSHSHFETRVKGMPIDPTRVISDFGQDVRYN